MVFKQGDQPGQFVILTQAVTKSLQAFTVTLWIRTATPDSTILFYTTDYGGLQNAEFALSGPEALVVFVKGWVEMFLWRYYAGTT